MNLIATGKTLPSQLVTADDLDVKLGCRRGQSLKKSGVHTRHFAGDHESQSQLGARALKDALDRAEISVAGIDLLIGACGIPEQALPGTASFIAHAAGLPAGLPAFDVNASCLSFLSALQVADSLLLSGAYRRIAIVSADLASRGLDWANPEASLIFGDGAAAAIVERGAAGRGLRTFKLATYPEGRNFCEIRAGGTQRNPRRGVVDGDFLFDMNGKAVFKLASRLMPDFLDALMDATPGGLDSIDCVVPHQASHLGMQHMAKRLGIAAGRIVDIYASHGNQVAASMPTALHEAFVDGRARAGKRLLMVGTAAGLNLGGLVWDL
ncbi:3-oxoacyl-[acyl-carrier-protein] synthase III C-terminal domain-containing protein [Chromobacterium vaccinii]|uniref:3-oxoacyl-[acyl-carrier-protein] synthase III C-terminal domain-containing protein n=1 Tax=Chromobacterium vaccinii TaxID=1108595 RepID=UPI000617BCE1|nr:3-oxoacyl-[acyl-carrier-protein] synthase III C-terminal domain-containing protein [Chromobacterium vaccinii]